MPGVLTSFEQQKSWYWYSFCSVQGFRSLLLWTFNLLYNYLYQFYLFIWDCIILCSVLSCVLMYVFSGHKVCSGQTPSSKEPTAQGPTEETPHPQIQKRSQNLTPAHFVTHITLYSYLFNKVICGDGWGMCVSVFYRWCLWCVCNLFGWVWGGGEAACAALFTW